MNATAERLLLNKFAEWSCISVKSSQVENQSQVKSMRSSNIEPRWYVHFYDPRFKFLVEKNIKSEKFVTTVTSLNIFLHRTVDQGLGAKENSNKSIHL